MANKSDGKTSPSSSHSRSHRTNIFDIKNGATKDVAVTMAALTAMFYIVLYCTAAFMAGVCKVRRFDGTLPFVHDQSFKGDGLAAWLTMVVGFLINGLLVALCIPRMKRPWDYTLSLSLIHLILSCIVMQDWPGSPQFWVTLVVVSASTTILTHVVHRKWHQKQAKISPKPPTPLTDVIEEESFVTHVEQSESKNKSKDKTEQEPKTSSTPTHTNTGKNPDDDVDIKARRSTPLIN